LLTESMVLALAGGIAGLLFAFLAVGIVRALPASYLPMASSVNLDGRVLLFTLGAAVLTAVIFGLAPALLAARTDVHETLKETGRSLGSRTSAGLRGALIVSEVALSLVLLVGAGLLLRSFSALYSTSTGFRADHALTFMLNIPDSRYAKPEQQAEFFRQVEERMRTLPGVEDVGMTSLLPLSGHFSSYSFNLANVPETESNPSIDYAVVNDDYFRVMGIPLLAGRLFAPQDRVGSPGVCLLNERAARALFPKGDAIGQHIQIGRQHDAVREIVGIVGTIKDRWLSQNPRNEGYEPLAQRPDTDISVVLRSRGDPAQLAAGVREQIRALDAQQPVAEVFTLDEVIAKSVSLPRFRTVLLGAFAGLALVLASVGLYGVLSYSVTQRTQEIGIRIALGAQRSRIYSSVIARGMLLVGIGAAIGLVGAIWLTRFIATFLYGVTPRDPATLAEMVAVLALVAVLACWIPARRASRVDPLVALRYE
jgi:putative ABC transport system permease protein